MPPSAVDAEALAEGVGFDGSSIRGFQEIQESDMLVVPGPGHGVPRPVRRSPPTLVLICNIRDPVTGQSYSRDARYIAQKAETYLKSTGRADAAYFGPEAEFFVFDDVRYGQGMNYAFHAINSREGIWNSRQEGGAQHRPQAAPEGRLLPRTARDSLQDLRTEWCSPWSRLGVKVEAHHHEVATAGQGEIDMRFTTLTRMADNLMLYKYVVKNVARKHGMTATFMPKPLFEDNASGMHVHQSLWKGDTNLFFGEVHYAGSERDRPLLHRRSPQARLGAVRACRAHHEFLPPAGAGLRGAHQPGLFAAQPLRLLPHPHVLAQPASEARGVPYARIPSCNGYLAFAAMLMAGLDGIDKRIDPGDPIDKNLYDLPPEEAKACARRRARWAKPSTRSRATTRSCSRATCSPRT